MSDWSSDVCSSDLQVRTVMQRILWPQVIRGWRAGFEEEAERLLDEMVEKEYVDGAKDLAETYVSTSFPKAMGIRHTSQLRQNWYLMGEQIGRTSCREIVLQYV